MKYVHRVVVAGETGVTCPSPPSKMPNPTHRSVKPPPAYKFRPRALCVMCVSLLSCVDRPGDDACVLLCSRTETLCIRPFAAMIPQLN